MPSTCCIPNCSSNYKKGIKASIFRFPSNEVMREKWLKAIPREGYTVTKSSRVCALHFDEHDIIRERQFYDDASGKVTTIPLEQPRLREVAIPKIFHGCPIYLTKKTVHREDPDDKKKRLESKQIESAIKESMKVHKEEEEKFTFSNYSQFLICLDKTAIPSFWNIIRKESKVLFLALREGVGAPDIKCSVVVNETLEVTAFIGCSPLLTYTDVALPLKVNDIRILQNVLSYMEQLLEGETPNYGKNVCNATKQLLEHMKTYYPENESIINFLVHQVSLISMDKHARRYSPDILITSTLLFSVSPHAYNFLRQSESVILPHPSTIKCITANFNASPFYEQYDCNFLCYAKEKCNNLENHEKIVTLMVDEIYIKEYLDYKGGNVVGMAFNRNESATSAHVFMIQSMLSAYKDVVHILPVRSICADDLHQAIKKVILGLEDIGFTVICVVTDNNSVNRKAMSHFSNPSQVSIVYEHPCGPVTRPLFFVIDTVHILKCIRNNWINQRNPDKCMFYPDFDKTGEPEIKTASFNTLKRLYEIEENNFISYNHTLTFKALNPSTLERQNVKLALRIFNEFVIKALLELGNKYNLQFYRETANYLEIIYRWWCIINVKNPLKGINKRNIFMKPITLKTGDECAEYLNKFYTWLDTWKNFNCTTGTLTKETHLALSHSTHALLEMSEYCINELNFKYFLCGKVQTDSLEERFGKYRRLAGCQYNISLRQLFECESKLRLQDSLPLSLFSGKFGNIPITKFDVDTSWEEIEGTDDDDMDISVNPDDLAADEEILPVLTFLAGYCIHSVCKHLKCESCLHDLTLDKHMICDDDMYSLISGLDRGSLKYPIPEIVIIVHYCFVITKKLLSDKYELFFFLKKMNQRLLVVNIAYRNISNLEFFDLNNSCASGHQLQTVIKKILWVSSNIYLKKYITKKNDKPTMKGLHKRKFQTLGKMNAFKSISSTSTTTSRLI